MVLWVTAAVPGGDSCSPSVSEILSGVLFLKSEQIWADVMTEWFGCIRHPVSHLTGETVTAVILSLNVLSVHILTT